MEVVLAVVLIVAAWIHGYYRGRQSNSIVEMSARDLRRALKRRK